MFLAESDPAVCQRVAELQAQALPDLPQAPVLGVVIDGRDVEIAPDLETLLREPTTSLSTLYRDGGLIAELCHPNDADGS